MKLMIIFNLYIFLIKFKKRILKNFQKFMLFIYIKNKTKCLIYPWLCLKIYIAIDNFI